VTRRAILSDSGAGLLWTGYLGLAGQGRQHRHHSSRDRKRQPGHWTPLNETVIIISPCFAGGNGPTIG
jgi:hypothetical protein